MPSHTDNHLTPEAEQPSQKMSLPLDPLTFLVGLWTRKWFFIVVVMISGCVALVVALSSGKKVYVSEALLLYEPPPEDQPTEFGYSLHTLVNLVKMRTNMEKVRKELELSATLSQIGKAVEVDLRRTTSLITIRATWSDPEMAAALANTTAEVFQELLRTMKREKLAQEAKGLEFRIKKVDDRLVKADEKLQKFILDNRILDVDKETEWYLEQLNTLATLREEAISKQRSLRKQHEDIDKIMAELKERVVEEQENQTAQMESTTETNVKIQRLRELISEEQTLKAREADLIVREQDLKRAKKLLELEAISQAEYEKIKALYDRAKAMVEESDDIKQWKAQIEKLDKNVVPQSAAKTASGEMLQQMMLRVFDLRLQEIALEEEAKYLDEAYNKTRDRAERLPSFRRSLTDLNRKVAQLEGEKRMLTKRLDDIKRKMADPSTGFDLVTHAAKPVYPKKSNRKLIFIAIVFLGTCFAGVLTIGLVLIDRRIKSSGEVRTFLPAEVYVTLKRSEDRRHSPQLRRAIVRLRTLFPKRSVALLVASDVHNRMRREVTGDLAYLFYERGESVLIVETEKPSPKKEGKIKTKEKQDLQRAKPEQEERVSKRETLPSPFFRVANLQECAHRNPVKVPAHPEPVAVLTGTDAYPAEGESNHVETSTHYGDLPMSYNAPDWQDASEEATFDERLPEDLTIDVVSIADMTPERLGSRAFMRLFEQVRENYSLVLFDTELNESKVMADYLLPYSEAVLFVAQAERTRIGLAKAVVRRVDEYGKSVACAILDGVKRPYW